MQGPAPQPPGTGQDGLAREERGWGRGVGGLPRWGDLPGGRGARGSAADGCTTSGSGVAPPGPRGRRARGPSQRSASCHPPIPTARCAPRCPPLSPPGPPAGPTLPSGPCPTPASSSARFSQAPVAPQRPGERRPRHLWHPHPLPAAGRAGCGLSALGPRQPGKSTQKGARPPPCGTAAPVTAKGFGHRPTPELPGVGGAPRTPTHTTSSSTPNPGGCHPPRPGTSLGELARKGFSPRQQK